MNSEVDWCFYFTQSVGHQTFNCCYVAIDARGWGFWQSESWFASVPITIVGECWWHFSLGKNSLQCSSMYCDVEICISFFLPATQKTLNVNPRLINPKRLFNWEGTIKKYQIIKSWLLGESPPNKPWLVDSVLTLVLSDTHDARVPSTKDLVYINADAGRYLRSQADPAVRKVLKNSK